MSNGSLFDPHELLIEKFIEVLAENGPASLSVAQFLDEVSDDSYLHEACHQVIVLKELIDNGVL